MEQTPSIKYKLVTLNKKHLEQLKKLHRECFENSQYSNETFLSFLTNKIYKTHAIVDKNKNILGFIVTLIYSNECDIVSIGTKKLYRKNGIASMLIQHNVKEYKLKKIFLEVACSNLSAIRFYKKQGFEIIHIRKSYTKNHHNERINGYLMIKTIDS